ncbi:hypothetical protein EXS70_03250 [Candidatus Peribacteria bacterium]|nr:hypothetical protein [Candidatus Peribacteria bacterium]
MAQQENQRSSGVEEDASLVPRLRKIQEFYEEYNRITHDVLGAASKQESESLMQWVKSANATEEEIADLEKHKGTYEQMLRSGENLQKDFMEKLDAAHRKQPVPLLSSASYKEWQGRFRNAYFKEKESFVTSQLPDFVRNWETLLAKRAELLKNPGAKALTTKHVQELGSFKNDKVFGELSNKKRIGLVASVQAALLANEKNVPQLFAQAKGMLETAARQKALSWDKVGVWLERIFKSGATTELIGEFINGSGAAIGGKKMTLGKLIANWGEASTHFHAIENKRHKKGTPRGFHFVKMNVFLDWTYEQRKAYLSEAENRFNNIKDESYVFLQIQHELGAKDWDSAEGLIDSVKKELKDGSLLMGEENRTKLQSMEKFLREHRSVDHPTGKAGEEVVDPDAMKAEMEGYLNLLPHELRNTYRKALNRGYQAFWALTTLMYNRVWCHQHNFLDTERERKMEAEAKEKTRERIEQGHEKVGHEANVLKDDTDTRAAVRDQSGVKGAQILFTNEKSAETLVAEVDEQKNDRNFWYWTSMVPQGVPYELHLQIVQTLHPLMKKLSRKMENAGVRFTLGSMSPALSSAKA